MENANKRILSPEIMSSDKLKSLAHEWCTLVGVRVHYGRVCVDISCHTINIL